MKMYSKLIKTFLLSGEMPRAEKKNKLRFYIILGLIATIFIFIPCFILMAFLVGSTTVGIKEEIMNTTLLSLSLIHISEPTRPY